MGWVKGSDRNFKASQTERYRKTKKDRRERKLRREGEGVTKSRNRVGFLGRIPRNPVIRGKGCGGNSRKESSRATCRVTGSSVLERRAGTVGNPTVVGVGQRYRWASCLTGGYQV